MSEYECLKLKDTIPVSILLDSSLNRITQLSCLIKELIGDILDTLGDIFKEVTSNLPEIGNPKSLKFVNPIFDTG